MLKLNTCINMHHMYKHASYLTVSLQCSRKYKNKQIFNFKIPYEIIFSIINKIKSNSDGSKTFRTTRVEHAFGMDPPAFVSRWNLNLSGHLATQIRQCKGRAVITYLNKRDQYNIIAPHTQNRFTISTLKIYVQNIPETVLRRCFILFFISYFQFSKCQQIVVRRNLLQLSPVETRKILFFISFCFYINSNVCVGQS